VGFRVLGSEARGDEEGICGCMLGETRLPPSPLAPSCEGLRHGTDRSTYSQDES
jgi:hypothetical protein